MHLNHCVQFGFVLIAAGLGNCFCFRLYFRIDIQAYHRQQVHFVLFFVFQDFAELDKLIDTEPEKAYEKIKQVKHFSIFAIRVDFRLVDARTDRTENLD